ncbi:MAG: protein kinase, partial [Gemmatimonadales bacterium]
MIGETFGHYHIVERIGKGGMGEVYRARDNRLDRDVALKILPEDAASADRVRRFEREAKAVAALKHPNIVTIHSVEEIDGRQCLTMELVEGKTLTELIPPGGMTLERFFDIAIPLADALSAAHTKGITHRDLKPSNVMLDADGRPKVLDFGLAKLFTAPESADDETVVGDDSVTAEGKIVGTVYYMSPEQAEAKEIDHRSDIFSLGVVLYEMATGDRPFQGDTPISTISSILKETPPAVTAKKSTLPRHLARVINRCLHKNPDKRFQTARDVCNELEELKKEVESGDIELSSTGSISTDALDLPSTRRRNPLPLLAGAVVVIAVLGYFAFFHDRSAPVVQHTVDTRPMTSLVGTELPGSWSPDGGFFAYTHSALGPLDIFVVSAAGGDPIKLVESPNDDLNPRWSPDNRWVAFVSNRDQKSGIYLVPPLGGPVQKLVETGFEPLSNWMYGSLGANPWSADGRTLIFARMGEGSRMNLWSVDIETRAETQLTTPPEREQDSGATVTFAGDRILFCRTFEGGSRLMTMPVSGGEPTEVYASEDDYLLPAWAPDGRSIIFSSSEGGIWALDNGSRRKRQVTTGDTEGGAVVSRTGEILYATFSHQTDLYVQNLDGTGVERLTRHTHDNFDAQISPDGTQVAYLSSRTGNSEIWLIDRASGRERQLTDREASDWSPSWSPDGREVVFASNVDGPPSLWIIKVDDGALRKLGGQDMSMTRPRWSPDRSVIGFLSYEDGEGALFLTDPQGTSVRKVIDRVDDFQWYRDAKHVIYKADVGGGKAEMRVANLETGDSRLLYDEPFREIAVAPNGSAVSFLSAQSHYNMNLHVLRLSAPGADGFPALVGLPEKITHGDGEWHVHNGGWSPDSKQ